jgi:hypothetical protein
MPDPLTDDTGSPLQNRRKHPRAPVDWPVTVISAQSTQQGRTVNLSRGGALIHLSQALTLGETVRLAFEIPDYQDVIVAKGEILRTFPLRGVAEEEFSHGAALKFTEISDENLKFFSGNLAPEWKDDYKDTVPIERIKTSQDMSRNTPILAWFLVFILLLPLFYFIYDSVQKRSEYEKLISQVEGRLLIIEEQFNSVQNSLNSLQQLDGKLNEIQLEMAHLRKKMVTLDSLEAIDQQIKNQRLQIQGINRKIEDYRELFSTRSINESKKSEEQHYVVKRGDTLFQISKNSGITIRELKEINNIDSDDAIVPGQKLKIK